jgi:hypothetical protein
MWLCLYIANNGHRRHVTVIYHTKIVITLLGLWGYVALTCNILYLYQSKRYTKAYSLQCKCIWVGCGKSRPAVYP